METKRLPCQKEWDVRKKLQAEGDKLYAESDKLYDEGRKLYDEGDKLYDEGAKLRRESAEPYAEGDNIFFSAIKKHYGEDTVVKWHSWHPKNTKTCHVCGDVYV